MLNYNAVHMKHIYVCVYMYACMSYKSQKMKKTDIKMNCERIKVLNYLYLKKKKKRTIAPEQWLEGKPTL